MKHIIIFLCVCVCACACVWVMEVGCSGGGGGGGERCSTFVLSILCTILRLRMTGSWCNQGARTSSQLQPESSSWSRCSQGAAAENVWSCGTSAWQRHYHIRLLVCQSMGLRWTHADVVKEVRPLKHTYVCSEERPVVCSALLTRTEVRRAQRTPAPRESCRRWTAHVRRQ